MKINDILNAIQILEKGGYTDFFNDEKNKVISEDELDNLRKINYSDNEINIIKKYLRKYDVNVVSSNKNDNVISFNKIKGERDIKKYILEDFVPYYMEIKLRNNSKENNKLYAVISLNKILEKGFNDEEVRQIVKLLNDKGIRVYSSESIPDLDIDPYDLYIDYSNNVYLDPLSEEELSNKFDEYSKEENIEKKQIIRNELVQRNMRLVPFTIWKYNMVEKYDMPEEELEQIGSIGLIRSVEDYDQSKSKFSSFAVNRVFWYISYEISKNANFLPQGLISPFYKVKNIIEKEYGKEFNGEEDMLEDIVDTMAYRCYIPYSVSYKDMIKNYIKTYFGIERIDKDSYYEENEKDYFDDSNEIVDNRSYDIIPENELTRRVIIDSLSKLTEREQLVMKLRYGIVEDENGITTARPLTLVEVAKNLNADRELIRQIEAKSLRKLRKSESIDELREIMQSYDEIASENYVATAHKRI